VLGCKRTPGAKAAGAHHFASPAARGAERAGPSLSYELPTGAALRARKVASTATIHAAGAGIHLHVVDLYKQQHGDDANCTSCEGCHDGIHFTELLGQPQARHELCIRGAPTKIAIASVTKSWARRLAVQYAPKAKLHFRHGRNVAAKRNQCQHEHREGDVVVLNASLRLRSVRGYHKGVEEASRDHSLAPAVGAVEGQS